MSRSAPVRGFTVAAAGWQRVLAVGRELAGAARETADLRSRSRLLSDVLMFRLLRLWPGLGPRASERNIATRGARLTYRLNRGDIQGIREVWIDQIYRMPAPHEFRVVVDLGANIGLTSVWLHHQYGVELVLGVEPDANNVDLARKNLKSNGVNGSVMHAAIGPTDGEARFSATRGISNLGRLSTNGEVVRQISMDTLLERLAPSQRIDLLKLDIEGAEQDLLLADDVRWLGRVDAIIAEFHPAIVDTSRLVAALEQHGFTYFRAGTLWQGSMDIFRRPRQLARQ